MRTLKLKTKKINKNPLFIKNSFLNIQLINNIKLKNLSHFFFRSNINLLKRSKEIIKFFTILTQKQKIKKVINSGIILVNLNNFVTNPNYLLNLRNQFFTKTFDILGYFCWSWYFSSQDVDSIENKNKFLENVIDKGLKKIWPTKYNQLKNKNSKSIKSILKLFIKLKVIKPKSRNIQRIYKIATSLGSSNFKKILLNKIILKKIFNVSKVKNWSVKLKNFINRENIIISKRQNPYLFLNNRFSQFIKPSKYSIESYIHKLNTNFYKVNSFRKRLLSNSLRYKKAFNKKSYISSKFFLDRINKFKIKTHPPVFLKKVFLNTNVYLSKTINRHVKQNIRYFSLKKNISSRNTKDLFKRFSNKIFKKFSIKQNRLLNFSLSKNLYTDYKFLDIVNFKAILKNWNIHMYKIKLMRRSKKKFNRYLHKIRKLRIQKVKNKKYIKVETLKKIKTRSRINPIFFKKKRRLFNVKSLTTTKSVEALAFWRSKFKRIKHKKLNLKVNLQYQKKKNKIIKHNKVLKKKKSKRFLFNKEFIKRKIINIYNQKKVNKFFKKKPFFTYLNKNFHKKKLFFYKNIKKKNINTSADRNFSKKIHKNKFKFSLFNKINSNLSYLNKFSDSFFKKVKSVKSKSLSKINPIAIQTIKLNSRTKKPFIFRNIGMFIWSQKKSFYKKFSKTKFLFKKKIYSFLFPNEVRKAIMNRRKAFKSYRFIYKTSSIKSKKPYYSLVFFKNNYRDFFKLEALNNSFDSINSWDSYSNYKVLLKSITREEVIYEDDFQNRGHLTIFQNRELFLKRIRFKPGYQRIWRQAREAALEHFNIKTVYQQQLTKYLSKFYRQAHYSTFLYSETTLGRTIIYSHLLPDYATINLFKNKNFIFLNGFQLPDLNTQVVPTDFIQLIVSNWFYIYNRWLTNTTLLRSQKFKRLVYRKGMASKYKVVKLRKQKSRYTPKWIYYSRFDNSDVRSYFEVDFLTMSMMVIYNPYILDYTAPDSTIDLRISIYKMYNWKYIT